MLGGQQQRKIVGDKSIGEASVGQRRERKLAARRGPGQRHPGGVAFVRTDQWQHTLRERHGQRQNQCEMSEFIDHVCIALGCSCKSHLLAVSRRLQRSAGLLGRTGCGFFQCVSSLGRHVVFVVLGQHLVGPENTVSTQLALRHHAFAFFK